MQCYGRDRFWSSPAKAGKDGHFFCFWAAFSKLLESSRTPRATSQLGENRLLAGRPGGHQGGPGGAHPRHRLPALRLRVWVWAGGGEWPWVFCSQGTLSMCHVETNPNGCGCELCRWSAAVARFFLCISQQTTPSPRQKSGHALQDLISRNSGALHRS